MLSIFSAGGCPSTITKRPVAEARMSKGSQASSQLKVETTEINTTTAVPTPTLSPVPTIEPTPTVTPKPKTETSSKCDPNYSGCVPIASDVDCAKGSGNGPAYVNGPVRVIGTDIYDLDRDGDGIGCD